MNVGLHLYILRIDKVLDILSKHFKSVYKVLSFLDWWESLRFQVALLGRYLRIRLITAHVFRREGKLTRRPQLLILLRRLQALFQYLYRAWTLLLLMFVQNKVCLSLCIHFDWDCSRSKRLTHSTFFVVRRDYFGQVKLQGPRSL